MKPLEGIKLGVTYLEINIEADVRIKVRALGGEFQYRLDAHTDFLLVGKRWADKYNFAVTHSIKLLDPQTFFSVYSRWKDGEENIDVLAELQKNILKPLAGLRICVSNMDNDQKAGFREVIEAAGGQYSEAMTARCAVLISSLDRGRKFNGARKWEIPVVHPRWLGDSVKFGSAIDPKRYDITNPDAEMAPPQRASPPEPLKRKLSTLVPRDDQLKRKKSFDLFARPQKSKSVILPPPDQIDASFSASNGPPLNGPASRGTPNSSEANNFTFSGLKFIFTGFDSWQLSILKRTVRSLHGEEVDDSSENIDYIVTNSKNPSSKILRGGKLITEWALERSLYLKRNALDDIWGKPVFIQPCLGLLRLRICISGFTGIEERHATLLVKLLGAEFCASLTDDRDVLIAASPEAHKVKFALEWHIPVVKVKWLWKCALGGEILPLSGFGLEGVPLSFSGYPQAPKPPVNTANTSHEGSKKLDSFGEPEPEFISMGVTYEDDEAEARAEILRALGESD